MREIKFRTWDIEQSEMMSWEEIEADWSSDGYFDAIFNNDHYHCMQYTGLKDRNGVEIYENDILECKEPLVWVVSFNERGCFVAHEHNNIDEYVLLDDFDFSVIGNIHQNPELLES